MILHPTGNMSSTFWTKNFLNLPYYHILEPLQNVLPEWVNLLSPRSLPSPHTPSPGISPYMLLGSATCHSGFNCSHCASGFQGNVLHINYFKKSMIFLTKSAILPLQTPTESFSWQFYSEPSLVERIFSYNNQVP